MESRDRIFPVLIDPLIDRGNFGHDWVRNSLRSRKNLQNGRNNLLTLHDGGGNGIAIAHWPDLLSCAPRAGAVKRACVPCRLVFSTSWTCTARRARVPPASAILDYLAAEPDAPESELNSVTAQQLMIEHAALSLVS